MSLLCASLVFGLFVQTLNAIPATNTDAAIPSVTLDGATFIGTTSGPVSKFLGIPFAQSPTGDLRFRLPLAINYTTSTNQATSFGPSCPQQRSSLPPPSFISPEVAEIFESFFQNPSPESAESEDCLSINVVKPASVPSGSKLPVVVWIYGGAFEVGSTSTYDGGVIVRRSIEMQKPVIYVSMNYRVALFGFLASQEVKDAGVGNLGLHDQREALRWIQRYIGQFGGDPCKVTIWGESAGSISVALQMLTNGGNTEGLFHAGFMQSGSPIPVGDIADGQRYYDAVVAGSNCSLALDTLACLRTVDFEILRTLMNEFPSVSSYQSLNLVWMPQSDGVFLKKTPQQLIADGSVARIPIVTGDCDDEGTAFSLSSLNVTTEQEVREYINTNYIPYGTNEEISGVLKMYPSDVRQGSPYNTGGLNAITPQFKRLASFQGDAIFQAPRRHFINKLAGKQNIWVFLSKRLKFRPYLGSAHATDLLNVYGDGEMRDYLVNFVTNMDPNGGPLLRWPQWTLQARSLLTFQDRNFSQAPLALGKDTFREEAMNFLINLTLTHPI